MLAMVLFGIGEILGCFFIGYIVDKKGSKIAVLVNLCVMALMTTVTLIFIIVFKFNWIAFVMCFLWGF